MKGKVILMLASLMLVFGTAACGKQIDYGVVNEPEQKQETSQEETDEGNSYEVNEILSDLTINDVSIDWPCELEDIRKVFELSAAYSFEDDVLCHDLYLDGDNVGQVYINEDTSAVLALCLSYFSLNDGTADDGAAVAFQGVTENSSYSDVVRLLGEPTRQSDREYLYIYYYDVGQYRTEDYKYDTISVSFKDDSIRSIEFYTKDFPKEW